MGFTNEPSKESQMPSIQSVRRFVPIVLFASPAAFVLTGRATARG